MYRYRGGNSSKDGLKKFYAHINQLGVVQEVRGHRWRMKWGLREALYVRGSLGTGRFVGVCWGYGGEGPRTLVEMLCHIGIMQGRAEAIAFGAGRGDKEGMDWRLVFDHTIPTEPTCKFYSKMLMSEPNAGPGLVWRWDSIARGRTDMDFTEYHKGWTPNGTSNVKRLVS